MRPSKRLSSTSPARKCIVIAPSHSDKDYRINRSIRFLEKELGGVDVLWDGQYPGHSKLDHDPSTYHYLEYFGIKQILAWFELNGVEEYSDDLIIYVHDPGLYGLFLCSRFRRRYRRATIIYDYHDSIFYEMFYQLKKRGMLFMYPFVKLFSSWIVKYWARSFDALVGISTGQLKQLTDLTGISGIPTVAIPNIREWSQFVEPVDLPEDHTDTAHIGWMGQVMKGRDLDEICAIVNSENDIVLHVFGDIKDQDYVDEMKASLGPKVKYYGTYSSDHDVREKLPAGFIGIFLGWPDPVNTGINPIASPNKYYSYINMGVPVIVGAKMTHLAAEIAEHAAGEAVESPSEIPEMSRKLTATYESSVSGMHRLKDQYLRSDLENAFRVMLRKVLA